MQQDHDRQVQLYGRATGWVSEPPKLRDLIVRGFELGYPEPDIEFGDGVPEGKLVAVPMVQVQLHSNQQGRRNVVAHCVVQPGRDVQRAMRLAVRAALAEALLLVETSG